MKTDATTLALTLAKEDVERIITDTIQAQIAVALAGTGDRVVIELITNSLNARVPRDKYARATEDDPTVLQKMVRDAITERAKGAVRKWLDEHEELIERNITAALRNQSKALSRGLVDLLHTLIDPTDHRNKVEVGIQLVRSKDYSA